MRLGALAAGAILLSACTVGPDYKQPVAQTPPEWQTDSYWRVAEPSHAPLGANWWTSYGDATLNGFVDQALAQNQTLAAALAHYAQARATLANNAEQRLPEVEFGATGARAGSRRTGREPITQRRRSRRFRTTFALVRPSITTRICSAGFAARSKGATRPRSNPPMFLQTRASCSPRISRTTTSRCANSTPRSTC